MRPDVGVSSVLLSPAVMRQAPTTDPRHQTIHQGPRRSESQGCHARRRTCERSRKSSAKATELSSCPPAGLASTRGAFLASARRKHRDVIKRPPTVNAVKVLGLVNPDFLIEIDAMAVLR